MTKLTVQDVRQARRLVRNGASITEVSRQLNINDQTLWLAVRGETWSHITDPAPVTREFSRTQQESLKPKACKNCGISFADGRRRRGELCETCYVYEYRTGRPRPVNTSKGKISRVLANREQEILAHARYAKGLVTIKELASEIGCSSESVYLRFRKLGLPIRKGNVGGRCRSVLSEAIVLHARVLVHNDGYSVAEVARMYGVPYATLHCAVTGKNWKLVGGPTGWVRKTKEVKKRPCTGCDLLTDHHSGVCVWCRNGK